MLLPSQVAASTAIVDSMQSMLDAVEERRKREEEKKTGQKPDPLLEARIGASTEAKRAQGRIAEALFGIDKVDINELKIQLMDKLGEKLGITREDGMSSYGYGRAIEGALKSIGTAEQDDLSKELGLDELDMSLSELTTAIKAPWGDENDRLEKALERQHGDGETTADEKAKLLQRLDDVADPKTLAELKLGPQYSDPTRVEDDETRAERLDDIKAREAGEKLDEIKDAQDAIHERLQQQHAPGETESASVPAGIDDMLLVTLTTQADMDAPSQGEPADDPSAQAEESASGTTTPAADRSLPAPQADGEELEMAAATDSAEVEAETLSARMDVDDIGLYTILKRRNVLQPPFEPTSALAKH